MSLNGLIAATIVLSSRDDKDIKWDEMNILQTLHPADKDYGHMKIDEPKTPYSYDNTDGEQLSDHETDGLDADTLAAKIAKKAMECPKVLRSSSEDDDEESEDENLTEEEKKKKREFEIKRKMHYNEFQAVKLARKLLEEEGEDEEDDELASHTGAQSDTSGNEESQANGAQSSTSDRIDIEESVSDQNR